MDIERVVVTVSTELSESDVSDTNKGKYVRKAEVDEESK